MCLTRSLLRWSLIAGIGLGATTLVVGPQRVGAAFAQLRTWSQNAVDGFVEDPVALRRQLEQLGAEYPGRIGQLRGELSQLDRQVHQLEQDCEVSRRVVAMTSADLDQVEAAIADAGAATVGGANSVVRTRLSSTDASSLRSEAKRIMQIRASHQDRLGTGDRQLSMLRDQRGRLAAILQKLEREHADFQIKLAALDRQIDAVGRNQRLIEMAREQAKVLAEYERGTRVGNLNQLEGRLEQVRLEQEAQLEVLLRGDAGDPYESAAREAMRGAMPAPRSEPAPSVPSSLQAQLPLPVSVR